VNPQASSVISIRALIRHIVICIGMAATVAISLTGAASATTDGPAELPRVYVTSTLH
jgi:hypothetical protein